MDLRAAAAVSLSSDDLQYRVGDPSRSSLIDIGDEDIGRSLIGEDIEAVSVTAKTGPQVALLVAVDQIRVKPSRITKLKEVDGLQ
jgi:hypothetical protein